MSEQGNMTMDASTVVIAGMGEVGRPLFDILRKTYVVYGVDIAPQEPPRHCSVLHICYPFQIPDFVATTIAYVAKYQPELVIIHSTVVPGTTQWVQQESPCPVAYSPVRGKHATMEQDMLRYRKFVAARDGSVLAAAEGHLQNAGFMTARFPSLEVGELAKVLETTWLGVLVAWTQEMERLAKLCGGTFEDVQAFTKEVDYIPHTIFPGRIGGHCVMPNIALLKNIYESPFFDAIEWANAAKAQSLAAGERETKAVEV
jgi:UDP-N-acetyl-D-mannosaminuronate dehydrogenase